MSEKPRLLIGVGSIAAHGGVTEAVVQQLIRQRSIPVWHSSGQPMTTAAALDEWGQLRRAGRI